MDTIEMLEYPKPILKVSVKKIVCNTLNIKQGEFYIKNDGKGTLKGEIKGSIKNISFFEDTFEGNKIKIGYVIDVSDCKAGHTIKSSVIIASNGGEIEIPLIINVQLPVLEIDEDIKIRKMDDILSYAKKDLKRTASLLYRNEFVSWLINTDYPYLSIYDQIVKDSNKLRVLDNFLILNKLKDRAKINISINTVVLKIRNEAREIISGQIKLQKIGFGYLEEEVKVKDKEWLSVGTGEIKSELFNEKDVYYLKYFINTSKIRNLAVGEIQIGGYNKIYVRVKRESIAFVDINKNIYKFEDEGVIVVDNYTDSSITVEILEKDSFIKFKKSIYIIKNREEINFLVKLNALQLAQQSLKKTKLIHSQIKIKIISTNEVKEKVININIGEVD